MGCIDGGRARLAGTAFLAATLAGCAALPSIPHAVADFPGVPPERDLRAEYRAAACPRIDAAFGPCERIVLREADERTLPAPGPVRAPGSLPSRYRIGLVPGLFAQCLAPIAKAFGDVDAGLRARGYAVTYLEVAGRGTATRNAKLLAEHLRASGDDPRPVILFAYSKGLTDALQFVVAYPEEAKQVAAIVSIAGAANGTPLADAYRDAYRDWLARLPMPGCATSDGAEIDDLRPEVRRAWWERHAGAVRVPVFSLVTSPTVERLSFGLQRAHASLSEIDTRNDGKILWYDQLVPGGYLLGFVNADHWAVATPLDASLPLLAFLFRDQLPRLALVEGALEVVAGVLAREAASR